ncbi:MAG: GNAT family N-acetyltransferase [Propionibacteriaceae bacterium]|nr:GNAT family N-acetyltransferase [Propionibacteriaceae bacterium]
MNIAGQRIFLRAIEPDDNAMLLEMVNDPDTEYMLGGWSFPVSTTQQDHWTQELENASTILRCAIDDHCKAVGVVMLNPIDLKNGTAEVHIRLASDARGKGYGADAVDAIVCYAFDELRLQCVYSHVSEHNIASKRLFLSCGFKEEGLLINRLYKRGRLISVYSLSKQRSAID